VPATTQPPLLAHRPAKFRISSAPSTEPPEQVTAGCWQHSGVAGIATSGAQPAAVQNPGSMAMPPAKKQNSIGPLNWKQAGNATQHSPPFTKHARIAEIRRAFAQLAVVDPAVAARHVPGHRQDAMVDDALHAIGRHAARPQSIGADSRDNGPFLPKLTEPVGGLLVPSAQPAPVEVATVAREVAANRC
jgi:hypothetical protein